MITWRIYTKADEEALLSLMQAFCEWGGFPFDLTRRRENVRYLAHHPDCGAIWLILEDDAVAGYAAASFGFSFEFGGRDAFLDELYVAPASRRKGVGQATVEFVMAELKSREIRQLHLEADLDIEHLKIFYQSCGLAERPYRLFSKSLV